MVKNFGGNKNKRLARKVISAPRSNVLRLPDPNQSDEQFACVSKLLGNGMCHVECGDGRTRLCVIRNKFRGRSKRDNNLIPGSFVLIDVRSWETATTGKSNLEKCDLLEVYNGGEMEKLKNTVTFDWNKFKGIGSFGEDTNDDLMEESGFQFTEQKDIDLEKDINDEIKETETNTWLQDDEINIDDI